MYLVFYLYKSSKCLVSKHLVIKKINTPQEEIKLIKRYVYHSKWSIYIVGKYPTMLRAQDKCEALARARDKRLGLKTTKEKFMENIEKDNEPKRFKLSYEVR